MKFRDAPLAGARFIDVEPRTDHRGEFTRWFCAREMAANGLEQNIAQVNLSHTRRRGTLRGLHYQKPPHDETKVVCCIRGRIFDVIVDLRADSPSRWQWCAIELSADVGTLLYIPAGFAHGFQTLEDDTDVVYFMGQFYLEEAAAGVRYDDPVLGIEWPLPVADISERDRSFSWLQR